MSNELRVQLKSYFSVYCEAHSYFNVKSYISDFLIKHLGYNPSSMIYIEVKSILKRGLSRFIEDLKNKGFIEAYNNNSYRIIKKSCNYEK